MQLALGIAVVVRRRHVASRVALSQPSAPEASASSRDAWPVWRDFRVVRRSFEDAAHSQYSFHLQPMDGLPLPAFLPGQFLTFSLPADGSGSSPEAKVASATAPSITRCYSLSDRPDPTGYRITIKRVPAPRAARSGPRACRPRTFTTACAKELSSRCGRSPVTSLSTPTPTPACLWCCWPVASASRR